MTITKSSIKALAKGFCGFEVLLVESDKKSLQHHAYVLLQNSHRVITTMKISEALSMIISRNKFDCVMIDAENRDVDLADFLHTIWSHRPQLRIIVMTSNESHLQLGRETLANDTIWFLRKPCGGTRICNMLQHVCRKRLAFGEGTSTGKSLEENQEHNVIRRVDNMHPSTIFNITMINNNRSSSNVTNQGLNINSQKYGAMCKPATYVDISSDDDDGSTTNKNICPGGTVEKKDKGKQPILELKSINLQKRKDINTRIAWTPALHGKFLEALTALGKEGAYPNAILKHMNVPGLTRAQVASHLQRIQEKENFIMKPRVVEQIQKGINLQVDSYACKRSGLSNTSDHNKASRLNCSIHQRALSYNSTGISCMTLDNIMDKLLGGQQLPLPQQTTTTVNNSAGDQAMEHHSGDQFQPLIEGTSMSTAFGLVDQAYEHSLGDRFEPLLGEESMDSDFVLIENTHSDSGNGVEAVVIGESFSHHASREAMAPLGVSATVESQYNLGTDANIFPNDFDNANDGLAPFDRFGIPVESCLTVGGGVEAPLNVGLDGFTFPKLISHDLGGVCHPQALQGNGENLFDVENADTVNFGHAGTSFPLHSISGVENNSEAQVQPPPPGNSIVPLDGSEGRVIDNDWYLKLIHQEHEDSFLSNNRSYYSSA